MPQEDRKRLVEWYELVRGQVPVLRRRFEDWLAAVRKEPALIWETGAVRYTVYGVGLIVLLWSVSLAADMLTPAPPAGARSAATTADFHVVCSDFQCGHHFVIHRKFGFGKFPVVCSRCQQKTGMQARRCSSTICQGRWVAPVNREGRLCCPWCRGQFE